MATLLLFNVKDEQKRTAIRLLSLRLGYTVQDVPPQCQGMRISDLLSGADAGGGTLTPFQDEMMVMAGFRPQDMHMLLDSMRNNGSPIRLKCVVTETNRNWTAARLHQELSAEDAAMRKRISKKHDKSSSK